MQKIDQSVLISPKAGKRQGVYLVLEGAGARGVAHVGAYSAISDTWNPSSNATWPELEIKGVAGTSCGALVAALIAVGYTPTELISVDGTIVLAETLGISSINQVFRRNGLKRILLARWLLSSPINLFLYGAYYVALRVVASLAITLLFYALIKLASNAIGFRLFPHVAFYSTDTRAQGILSYLMDEIHYYWPYLGTIWLILFVLVIIYSVRTLAKGQVSVQDLVDWLDKAISDKLIQRLNGVAIAHPEEASRIRNQIAEIEASGARFKHLEFLKMRLRIVACDINAAKLATFSRTETPNVKISDAVGASIAIPALFKKFRISGRSVYHDGGLVSVLPAWAFENMHNLEPESIVVAISLIDPIRTVKSEGEAGDQGLLVTKQRTIREWGRRQIEPFRELIQSARAAIFGRSSVDIRYRERVVHMNIPTTLGPLDFDAFGSRSTIAKVMTDAKQAAGLLLAEALCNEPHRHMKFCKDVVGELEKLLHDDKLPEGGVIRMIIARPHANKSFLNILFGRKYFRLSDRDDLIDERIPDDQIVLPSERTDTGRAFLRGAPLFPIDLDINDNSLNSEDDFYRKIAKDSVPATERAKWRWAIPVHEIFYREDPMDLQEPLMKEGRREGEGGSAKLVICIESNLSPQAFGLEGERRYHFEVLIAARAYEELLRTKEDRTKFVLSEIHKSA